MPRPARLLAVSTAVPPHRITQVDAAEAATRLFADRFPDYQRLARVFESAGIVERFAVRPIEWYADEHGWPDRTIAYLDGAAALFVDAATAVLDKAGISAADVDGIVTVSSTGIATPSLEARAASRMGFRPDVRRVPVFGLGCGGGVTGLAIAGRLAAAEPGSTILLVAVEVCTLAFRLDQLSKANIVATALFGDGAAACLVRADDTDGIAIEMAGEHQWPDTLDIMGWTVDPQGLGVIFDRAIPPFARDNVAGAVRSILAAGDLEPRDVDRFVCHPGGRRVVEALEEALGLADGALDHERDVLAAYGNMSAPTALFVLDRVIDGGLPERSLLMAMGPGFTASAVSLKRQA